MAFAGDMPLVSPEFIKTMCSIYSGKPIVPQWKNGKLEPMMAIYNNSLIPGLKSYIESMSVPSVVSFNIRAFPVVRYMSLERTISSSKHPDLAGNFPLQGLLAESPWA